MFHWALFVAYGVIVSHISDDVDPEFYLFLFFFLDGKGNSLPRFKIHFYQSWKMARNIFEAAYFQSKGQRMSTEKC